ITAKPTDLMKDVVARLKQYNVSQLPVVDEDGQMMGIVTEIDLLNHMLLTDHVHQPDETIESMIDPNVPVVRPGTPLETLMAIFSNRSAVVIATDKQIQGILTKIDILDFLSTQVQ
ncbi:MAG: CBS domain-containing protein, partial [Anaerolineales bacterium]|nr:CBS domain-containing protein [Anaerolineales bacterium]